MSSYFSYNTKTETKSFSNGNRQLILNSQILIENSRIINNLNMWVKTKQNNAKKKTTQTCYLVLSKIWGAPWNSNTSYTFSSCITLADSHMYASNYKHTSLKKKPAHGWLCYMLKIETSLWVAMVSQSWVQTSFRLCYPVEMCFELSCWFLFVSFVGDLFWDPYSFILLFSISCFSSCCSI